MVPKGSRGVSKLLLISFNLISYKRLVDQFQIRPVAFRRWFGIAAAAAAAADAFSTTHPPSLPLPPFLPF